MAIIQPQQCKKLLSQVLIETGKNQLVLSTLKCKSNHTLCTLNQFKNFKYFNSLPNLIFLSYIYKFTKWILSETWKSERFSFKSLKYMENIVSVQKTKTINGKKYFFEFTLSQAKNKKYSVKIKDS